MKNIELFNDHSEIINAMHCDRVLFWYQENDSNKLSYEQKEESPIVTPREFKKGVYF